MTGDRRPAACVGGGDRRHWVIVALAACVVLTGACARAMGPPGGERDETPPAVIGISPEPMSSTQASNRPAVIVFDERISERNYRDAVYVSPATGAVDVSKGRSELEVRIGGGWQPGRVYRVVVLPVLQDLFNNPLARPIEFAFSTGAPFSDAAVAGLAYERVTGERVPDVRVEARPADGGAYHLALSEPDGVFRMPMLPPGTYLLRGYVDQNRDRQRDPFEPADSMTIEVGATDTLLRALALMRPDSSAANLTHVEVVDSVTLRLQLDDYMDVRAPQELATVRVRSLPDSASVPLAGVHYPHALAAARARQDSIARDSALVADTTASDTVTPLAPRDTVPLATGDTTAVDSIPPDPLAVRVREAGLGPATGEPLPARELMVLLERPLVPEAEYRVELGGILNLAGVGGGGGSTTFRAPAAPPPPPAPEGEVEPDEATPAEPPSAEPPPAEAPPADAPVESTP